MRPVEDFVILFAFRWNSLENYSQQQHSNYAYWIDDFIAILMAALVKMNCWAFIRGKSLHFFHCVTKWNMQKCLLYTSIRNSGVSHQIDGMNVLVAEIPWFSFARTTKIILNDGELGQNLWKTRSLNFGDEKTNSKCCYAVLSNQKNTSTHWKCIQLIGLTLMLYNNFERASENENSI